MSEIVSVAQEAVALPGWRWRPGMLALPLLGCNRCQNVWSTTSAAGEYDTCPFCFDPLATATHRTPAGRVAEVRHGESETAAYGGLVLVGHVLGRGYANGQHAGSGLGERLPDFRDAVTVGGLLGLVRIAHDNERIHASALLAGGWGVWRLTFEGGHSSHAAKIGTGSTEAAALVDSLRSAPRAEAVVVLP